MKDGGGNEVLNLHIASLQVYASDGYQAGSQDPRPHQSIGFLSPNVWMRLDIALSFNEYSVTLDRGPTLDLWAFHPASNGTVTPSVPGTGTPPSSKTAEVERILHYSEDARLTPFRDPLSVTTAWGAYATEGSTEVQDEEGHMGFGRLAVIASGSLTGLTYIHTSLSPFNGSYIAEASFLPWRVSLLQPNGVPDNQAVLAALSGPLDDPDVQWALVMSQEGLEHHRWALYFIDQDGHRTRVSPVWVEGDNRWHSVRVHVEETSGEVVVAVDDEPVGRMFQNPSGPSSERLAIGDVWVGQERIMWTGGGTAYYDNVAVAPTP